MTNPADKRYRNRITQRKSFVPDSFRFPITGELTQEAHIFRGGPRERAPAFPNPSSFQPPKIEHLQAYVVARENGEIVERGIVVALDNHELWWCLPQLNAADVWVLMSKPPFNQQPPSAFSSAFGPDFTGS